MEEESLLAQVQAENVSSGYQIRDDVDAERALKRIAELTAEFDSYINSYKQRVEAAEKRKREEIGFYEDALHQYFDTVDHKVTKTQETYQLANGTITLKVQEPLYKRNDAELVPWLTKNAPGYIKTEQSVTWDKLKKLLFADGKNMFVRDSGEYVPGIEVV